MTPLFPQYRTWEFPVWKVLVNPAGTMLAIETRDRVNHVVQGWTFDLRSESLVRLSLPDTWWIQLGDFSEKMVIWQGFQDQSMPISQGIYALEVRTGSMSWMHEDLQFKRLGPEIVIACAPERPELLLWLDQRSGAIRERVERSAMPWAALDEWQKRRQRLHRFPDALLPDHPGWKVLSDRLMRTHHIAVTGPLTQLVAGHWELTHGYTQLGNQAPQGFLAFCYDQIPLRDVLSCGEYSGGFVLDPFFVVGEWLIWMEGSCRLGRCQLAGLLDA